MASLLSAVTNYTQSQSIGDIMGLPKLQKDDAPTTAAAASGEETESMEAVDAGTEQQNRRKAILAQLQEMAQQTTPAASALFSDNARLAMIKDKLRSGKKLSAAEMNYLKENYPAVYEKAQKAERAREELQAQLKKARSKEEARTMILHAQLKAVQEAQAGGDETALQPAASPSSQTAAVTVGTAAKETVADVKAVTEEPAEIASGGAVNASGDMAASEGDALGNSEETLERAEDTKEGAAAAGRHDTNNGEKPVSPDMVRMQEAYLSALQSCARPAVHGAEADTPLDTKMFYTIKALQDEGIEFFKSKRGKNLPERRKDAVDGALRADLYESEQRTKRT